jgi:proliferating cell nuclear antigen
MENNLNQDESSKLLLKVVTCQTSSFRTLIEALKEILKDVNIKFTIQEPDQPNTGAMTIVAMNISTSVLIKLKIPASSFDSYYCKPRNGKQLLVGVNMNSLYKLIKTMNNEDNLTLYIDENDINNLCIKLENGEKNLVTTYKLKLLEISDTSIPIPDASFPFMISIPSAGFHKIIRDTSSIAEYIDIQFIDTINNPNTLIFSCRGDFASQTTTFTDKTTGFFINKTEEVDKNDTIVQGLYDLKNLSLFSKCGNLCNNIELYMMNKYPLFIKYKVGNLGEVYLVLSPINTNNNLIESDDDDDDDDDDDNDNDD